jgi:hypothetical protein
MTRVKTQLRAPEGVTESLIEGTYYIPNEDSLVETTNGYHVGILTQHGYEIVSEVAIVAPARSHGPIEIDELGRGALSQALQERGLSFPTEGSRDDLAEIAQSWNQSLRRPTLAPAPAPRQRVAAVEAIAEPEADEPAEEEEVAEEEKVEAPAAAKKYDWADATYDEMKGWCAARGIVFKVLPKKEEMRQMCIDADAKARAPKAA